MDRPVKVKELIHLLMSTPPQADVVVREAGSAPGQGITMKQAPNAAPMVVLHLPLDTDA